MTNNLMHKISNVSRSAKRFVLLTLFLGLFFGFGFNSARAAGGKLDATFNPTILRHGNVNVMAKQSDGKLLIGGVFFSANGTPRHNIARLNADGSLDLSFDTGAGMNSSVHAITIQTDGKILVGGLFTSINGTARNRIARLNADGSLDASFDPGAGASDNVLSIAVQPDGKVVIGGSFGTVNGTVRNFVARLNANGSFDATFNTGAGPTNIVRAVAVQPDGKILVAGNFIGFNGQLRRRIVRLNSDGSLDDTFTIGNGASNTIYALSLQADGKIYIAGIFGGYNGIARLGVARLNSDGTLDTTFVVNLGPQGYIGSYAIAVQPDGKVIVGGTFSQRYGATHNHLARLNPNGTLDASFNPGAGVGANSDVNAIVLANDQILIGGSFSLFNGVSRSGLARLNADGSPDAAYNPALRARGGIYELQVHSDGKIVIGGDFFEVNGVQRNNIARLNSDGSLDASFNPGTGVDAPVRDVDVQADGKVLVTGYFNSVNGVQRRAPVRLNVDGSVDESFAPTNDGDVYTTTLQPDGKILIGGFFSSVNGVPSGCLARLNSDGSVDTSFGVNVSGEILEIATQPDGKVIIGGFFSHINLITRSNIGRLNPNGSLDESFNPGTGTTTFVWTIKAQPDGKILIGGDFFSYNGVTRQRVARLNSDGSLDTSFNPPSITGSVYTVQLQADGKVIIGGRFTLNGGLAFPSLARLNIDGSVDNSFKVDMGFDNTVYTTGFQADGKLMVGGYFSALNGVPRFGIARLSVFNAAYDFDGDGKTDASIFRPAIGYWYILNSANNSFVATQFGQNGDSIVPADYDGDGRADMAVFRQGVWYVLNSYNGSFRAEQFGVAGDVPTPADYDSDGVADLAVFRGGSWYLLHSSNGAFVAQQFGIGTDKPVAGDYDGDGKTDIAVFREGAWYITRSSNQAFIAQQFGTSGDVAVPGDYDGDGKNDLAVFRPSTNTWYILHSSNGAFIAQGWGFNTDKLAPGDYDGDGKTDIAVWRPGDGAFYILNSGDGSFSIKQWGAAGDVPAPSAFVLQ